MDKNLLIKLKIKYILRIYSKLIVNRFSNIPTDISKKERQMVFKKKKDSKFKINSYINTNKSALT